MTFALTFCVLWLIGFGCDNESWRHPKWQKWLNKPHADGGGSGSAAFIVGCFAHFAAYKWQIWVDRSILYHITTLHHSQTRNETISLVYCRSASVSASSTISWLGARLCTAAKWEQSRPWRVHAVLSVRRWQAKERTGHSRVSRGTGVQWQMVCLEGPGPVWR